MSRQFKLANSDNPIFIGAIKKLTSLSWNIEGLKRNVFALKDFTEMYSPDLLFLSETQIFQADYQAYMKFFSGEYSSSLNSEDLLNLDIPMISTRPKGGTLVMWKHCLDPFVTVHKTDSSAYLPIVLDIPNFQTSIHVAVYLPSSQNGCMLGSTVL